MHLENHHRYLLKIGLILTLALVIGGAIMYPTIYSIITTSSQIRIEQIELEQKVSHGLDARQIGSDLVDAKIVMEKAKDIFISPGGELAFIKILEELALKHAVNINIVPTFNQDQTTDHLTEFPIQINIAGSYSAIIKLIDDIERLPYYYLPANINITGRAVGNQPASAVINGSVYITNP